jgi:hypothetical protein
MLNNVTFDTNEIAESLRINSSGVTSFTNVTFLSDGSNQNSTIVSIINMGYISRILPSVVAMSILFALSG